MLNEVWGQFVRFPADARMLPPGWETGGKFQALPLPGSLTLPAAVRRSLGR
jgi:hypothetical protein